MLTTGLILLAVGALAMIVGANILDDKPESVAGGLLVIIGLIVLFAGFLTGIIGYSKSQKKTFKIIKVDSTHVYKLNESGDSLIIENR